MESPDNTEEASIDGLYHRARLVMLGYPRPISRLRLDVVGVDSFNVEGPTTPSLALLMASPELTPPAREILQLTLQLFGEQLFTRPSSQLLKRYAVDGLIATAETMLLMDHSARLHALYNDRIFHPVRGLVFYNELLDGFESVFARHPQVVLARARRTLDPYSTPQERS
ncbi:hypothetical protein [Burkholderia sp. PAMC 26561]|uniref:hypothetical protein n=1 Tax=Burkholderia sp. PAMC 26561 TaxID=1795043 RepID=UPI000B2AD951|nr:hypothetical protein [Burkholderia sp. PAMC 26561]